MRRSSLSAGLTVAAFAAASGFAAPAAAQQSRTVTLLGQAGQACSLSTPTLGSGQLENFIVASGNVYAVQQLADPNTLTIRAARLSLSFDAMCNGVHRVVVTSENSGLWRSGAAASAPGFGTAVPYRVELNWADENDSLLADAASRQRREWQMLVGRPNAGELALEFQIVAGETNAGLGAPMIAGGYADVLTLTVESQ